MNWQGDLPTTNAQAPVNMSEQTEKVRSSEDVKEILALARKLARKQRRTSVTDQDFLRALLLNNRVFTRFDALLKQLGISPRRLEKTLNEALKNASLPPEGESTVLLKAEQFARHASEQRPVVEVEHLLKALLLSSDPVITLVFSTHHVTEEKIDQATAQVKSTLTVRNSLFMLRELAEVIVFVLVFLILIKSFLGELRLIPSESMVPTLKIDDRVVIERVSQWYRPYQRGDIIVFYPPGTQLKDDPWSVFLRLTGFSGLIYKKEDNIDVAYIKRLIGLPGDKVEVRPNDGVYVNGHKLDEPYINEISRTCTLVQPFPYCDSLTVPKGHYFMLGDNRNQSADSRYWGFEPEERVIGRAVFRIWPVNRLGTIEKPSYDLEGTQKPDS